MAPHSNRKLSKRRSSGRDNYLTKIKGKKPFSVSEFVGSRVSNASKKAINYINKDFMNKASKTKKKLQRKILKNTSLDQQLQQFPLTLYLVQKF